MSTIWNLTPRTDSSEDAIVSVHCDVVPVVYSRSSRNSTVAVYRHSMDELENNSTMPPVASLDTRDVSRCGQLHSVVPMMSDELLALVFRNGHVLLQRTRDRQHTRSEVVITSSSTDGGKRSSSALCVEYCSAISSTSLLLLVREAGTYRVVIVGTKSDKRDGEVWRQTHTKLMSSSDAVKASDAVVDEDKSGTAVVAVACCYNTKSKLLIVIYSNGLVIQAQVTGNRVRQQALRQRLDLSTLGKTTIHAAAIGDHIVLVGTKDRNRARILLWSSGFTCLLDNVDVELENIDASKDGVIHNVVLRDDGAVFMATDRAILSSSITLHKVNLAMTIERQEHTRQFLLDSAPNSGAPIASAAISVKLTPDNINNMMRTEWSQYVKEELKTVNQQRYDLLNVSTNDKELVSLIIREHERTDGLMQTPHFVSELAARCLRDKLIGSFEYCVNSGLVRMSYLGQSMDVISILDILQDAGRFPLLQNLLDRVPDLSAQQLILIVRWLLHDADEKKLRDSIPNGHAEPVGNALEYYLSLVLATVNRHNDILVTKHAGSFSMDEVAALLKLLSKQIHLRWTLVDNRQKNLCNHMPSMDSLLLWVQILLNAHFSHILLHERAMAHLQSIRAIIGKEMEVVQNMSTLPGQMDVILGASEVQTGAIRTKLPARNEGVLDYEIQVRRVAI